MIQSVCTTTSLGTADSLPLLTAARVESRDREKTLIRLQIQLCVPLQRCVQASLAPTSGTCDWTRTTPADCSWPTL